MLIHRRAEASLSGAASMGLPVTGACSSSPSCSPPTLTSESNASSDTAMSTAMGPSHRHHPQEHPCSCSPGEVEYLPSPAFDNPTLRSSSQARHPRALLDDGVIISRRHDLSMLTESQDAEYMEDGGIADAREQHPRTGATHPTNQHASSFSSSGVDPGHLSAPHSPRTKSFSGSFLTSASRRRQSGSLSGVPTRNARSGTFPASASLTEGPSSSPSRNLPTASTGSSSTTTGGSSLGWKSPSPDHEAPTKRPWSKTLLGRHLHATSSSLRSIPDDAESAGSSPSTGLISSLVSSPMSSASARFSSEARASALRQQQQGARGSVSLHHDSCQLSVAGGFCQAGQRECNGQSGVFLDDSPPESNPTTPRLPHRKHSPMSSFVKALSVNSNSGPAGNITRTAGSSARHSEQEMLTHHSRSHLALPKMKSVSARHQRSISDPADGDPSNGPAPSGQSKAPSSLARQVSRLLSHHWNQRTAVAVEGSDCADEKQHQGLRVGASFREEPREASLSVDYSDGRVTAGNMSSRTAMGGDSTVSSSDALPSRSSTLPSQSRPGNAISGGGGHDVRSTSLHGASRGSASAFAEEIASALQGWSTSGSMASLKDFLLDPEEIEMGEVIAVGASGEVSRAAFRGETVAVKVLKRTITKNASKQFFIELRREVCTFVSCSQCPQLLQFCGLFVDSQSRVGLVTRYMEGGTLYKFLRQRQRKGARLSLQEILSLAEDVAQGMSFLHAEGVIHRDLKSENVLLSGERRAVICDFGMARLKDDQGDMTNEVGTYRWMAPEAFGATNWPVTKRADVYSFGIILWELVTLSVPFEKMNSMQAAMAVGIKGQRPPIPADCNLQVKQLIQQCWVANPDHRPDFSDILCCLNGINVN